MIVDDIKKCEMFSPLKDKEIDEISVYFEQVNYQNNDYIFMEGDPCTWFYIVVEGRVKVLKHSHSGKDVILEIMSPGDMFGCVAVMDNKPYPASAQAMELSTVIRIGRQNFLKIMDEFPILKLGIAKFFSDRLRDAHDLLKNIATERVERRIASLLIKLSEKIGVEDNGYKKIDFPLTRQEIAEMVGTTVETCIRTISKFQKKGAVKSSGNRILIKNNSLQRYLTD